MAQKKQRPNAEINAASMADIAFLLLIFFLVATTFPADKGLTMVLPPKPDPNQEKPKEDINDRNLFRILVNSENRLLVEDEPMKLKNLKEEVRKFVDNHGANVKLSDSPQKAVVSIKADRGTKYETYIQVLDQVKAAYHELRAKELGWTIDEYLDFTEKKASESAKKRFKQAVDKYPIRISEADPNQN